MIRYLKLISGVEVVGEVISENGLEITMRVPMKIEYIDRGGHYACGLATYCVGSSEVTFNAHYVVEQGAASEQFQEAYSRRQDLAGAVFETDGDVEADNMPLYEGVDPDEIEDDSDGDDLFDAMQPKIKQTLH